MTKLCGDFCCRKLRIYSRTMDLTSIFTGNTGYYTVFVVGWILIYLFTCNIVCDSGSYLQIDNIYIYVTLYSLCTNVFNLLISLFI